ncbi:MAG: rhodanese-like domain-containing protein [Deltaproteobacteria bacterium]|nr:rhodanese-like domain-containing protein [Deltaproteobacteria bacterium]
MEAIMEAPRISKDDLKRKMDSKEDFILLDVRNPTDYGNSNVKIPGSIRIPLAELEVRIKELDKSKEAVAYCT